MATLQDIKRKIGAVKKTAQITKAMNMVAAAKMRTVQQRMMEFRPYADKITEMMQRVSVGIDHDEYPLSREREEIKTIEVLVFTSDRGLCGAFNNNILVAAERFIKKKREEGLEVVVSSMSRKSSSHFRKRKEDVRIAKEGLLDRPSMVLAQQVGEDAMDRFLSEDVDEVYIVHARFISMANQLPTVTRLLPIAVESQEEEQLDAIEYIVEPSENELLNELLPVSLNIRLLNIMLETAVSEHAARMAAMENATNNCNDLVKDLTLVYNKARQAAITKELMDIVGGAEALRKG